MSDLISRKALLNDFRKTITEQFGTIDWLNMISRQETAYDVDKVVEVLEHMGRTPLYEGEDSEEIIDYLLEQSEVIDIVKRGGKDERT